MKSDRCSRRDFFRLAAMSTAAVAIDWSSLNGRLVRAATGTTRPDKPQYRFVLLGDTHYDLPEHHDMNWVQAEKPNDVSQIHGYIDVSRNHTPVLMQRVKEVVSGSDVPVPFVIHVGDLVEGLCGSYELHSKQFKDAMGLVDASQFGVPFLMSKGNHDITGPGAADAYEKVLLPWLSKQYGQTLASAAYIRRHGDDLFVFFDAYKPDLDWLETELSRNADARRTFFVIHEPVVPYNDRADWIVYANDDDSRQKLMKILGSRRAIVLSGHLHKYSVLERNTDTGPFTQLAVCSVIRSAFPKPRDLRDGVAGYNETLLDLEPKFNPATLEHRRALLKGEQADIRRFEYADLPGYAVVDVYENGITCNVYAGTDQLPWRSRQA